MYNRLKACFKVPTAQNKMSIYKWHETWSANFCSFQFTLVFVKFYKIKPYFCLELQFRQL